MSHVGWTGVVLTGGKSSRMGRDKALIEIGGITLLRRAVDLLRPFVEEALIIGDPVKHALPGVRVLPDDLPGLGPLGGLVTALGNAGNPWVVVLACDMPGLTPAFIARIQREAMNGGMAIVPEHNGRIEPLAACHHRDCLPVFRACIAEGRLKMSDAIERVRPLLLPVLPGKDGWPADLFRNVNAPGDL